MIKISRISSPLKDKIKNVDTCSQLDGDGVFEGKYKTTVPKTYNLMYNIS